MSFRSYLILMTLATVIAWIAWAVVLNGVDPTRSGILGFLLFYLTFLMALFGTISLLGLLVRLWHSRTELPSRMALRSFRQGILLTLLFTSSLILFSQGWFRWWTMLLVVVIFAFVELAFLSSRHS
ncbi:hypothetical protein EPN81_00335 [Patescibacteria group bacterium]|nr:MAG: hypothetical protein EPN81_00335 [Patescibacteria group bacterium]